MRVSVQEVISTEPLRVRFRCPFGAAVALWRSALPLVPADYDVEFTVDQVVDWGCAARVCEHAGPSIAQTPEGLRICGVLDGTWDDGVVAIRMGPSLFLAETSGELPTEGARVCLEIDELELYATGI